MAGLIFFAVAFVGVPLLFPAWQFTFSLVPGVAIAFLALVALVGFAGQISLAHAALAGVGAIVAARIVSATDIPFAVAVVIGGLAAVIPGTLLAWRAVRLSPLFLGFATLAFAALFQTLMFTVPAISNGLRGVQFDRPVLTQSALVYYFVGLSVFAVLALVVTNLRRGRTGLLLQAMRDSPAAIAGFGASLVRLKLVVFAVSAFLAGVGGAILVGTGGIAEPTQFVTLFSLVWLALAVVGGISSWSGALIGAGLFTLMTPFFTNILFPDSPVAEPDLHQRLDAADHPSPSRPGERGIRRTINPADRPSAIGRRPDLIPPARSTRLTPS